MFEIERHILADFISLEDFFFLSKDKPVNNPCLQSQLTRVNIT